MIGRTPEAARGRLRTLCKREGIPYLGLHALRHTAGTRLVRAGFPLQDVAEHLGHRRPTPTASGPTTGSRRTCGGVDALLRWGRGSGTTGPGTPPAWGLVPSAGASNEEGGRLGRPGDVPHFTRKPTRSTR
ncbi:tyrosine-type recombinase/integrase [Deinococcus aestuarii]|uniref:tyrosine-type recombinase/integrase n=1 Tax=Deinococcus aestuarii TaxID=2774531 RepID=UPI003CCEB24F